MTSRPSGREVAAIAVFGVLSIATSLALLSDLRILSFDADETILAEMIGIVRRLVAG